MRTTPVFLLVPLALAGCKQGPDGSFVPADADAGGAGAGIEVTRFD